MIPAPRVNVVQVPPPAPHILAPRPPPVVVPAGKMRPAGVGDRGGDYKNPSLGYSPHLPPPSSSLSFFDAAFVPAPPLPQPPSVVPAPPIHPPPPREDEPVSKKMKSEDNLMPEEEFLRRNKVRLDPRCLQGASACTGVAERSLVPPQGPVAVKVQVPNMQDKTEWKLSGQVLNFTVPLTDQVGERWRLLPFPVFLGKHLTLLCVLRCLSSKSKSTKRPACRRGNRSCSSRYAALFLLSESSLPPF